MNLVQTLPELQTARLGGISGVGYAEVISVPDKEDECRGVIVFDAGADIASLPARHVMFEGIVYLQDGEEVRKSLSVDVLLVNRDKNQEPGATFVARWSD